MEATPEVIGEGQQQVAGVRFTKVGKLYHFDYSEFPELAVSDYVIVETARGRHMGQVMGFIMVPAQEHRQILRIATPRDFLVRQQWEARQPATLQFCQEKARELGGYSGVKFVAAQYNYDGTVLTFLYAYEDRINFTPLLNVLRREFPMQIEMRQIGPRDVAKLLGGHGACGELRCCSTFLTDFSPVSIKMAKAQGISLDPTEITGMCGRLRCCLVYEYEQYVAARKQLPKRNKRVGTPEGIGRVVDVYPMQDAVSVFIEEVGFKMFTREELIPLEELEALQNKASKPCDKHGDGPCDCGKQPGERMQDQVNQPSDEDEAPEAALEIGKAEPTKSRRRKSRRSKNKGAAAQPQETPGIAAADASGQPTEEAAPIGDQPAASTGQKPKRKSRRRKKSGGNKPDTAG